MSESINKRSGGIIQRMSNMHSVNWVNVLVLAVITTFATLFALANQVLVQLHFFGVSTALMPLYLPIFFAFLLGFFGGVLALSFSRRKHKEEIRRLHEEHIRLQQEVDNLRNIPLQDDV